MESSEKVTTIILSVISGGLITEIARFIFSKFKNINEQRAQVNVEIIRKRIEAIQEARSICTMMNVIEFLEIAHPEEVINSAFTDLNNSHILYNSILENNENWVKYYKKISEVINKYNEWYDCETAAWFLYLSKYTMSLYQYINSINLWNKSYCLGTIFIADLQKWQKEFDSILVKKLNKISMNCESHYGVKWEKHKKIMEIRWRKTVLFNILNNSNDNITQMALSLIYSFQETNSEVAANIENSTKS